MNTTELSPRELYQHCDLSHLPFNSTAELEPLPTLIGQQRALDAIDFGVKLHADGYNLYVMGPTGVGKNTLVRRYLEQHIKDCATPDDWAYLNNFDDPQKPNALALAAGQGIQLKRDIERVISDLEEALTHAFDDEYYRGRLRAIEEAARKHRVRLFRVLQTEADKKGVVLLRLQDGSYAFAAKRDGEPLTSEEFATLPVEQQEETEEAIASLHEELQQTLLELREWERDNLKKIDALNEEVAKEVISGYIDKLRHAFPNNPTLQRYFSGMQQDIEDNVDLFIKPAGETSEESSHSHEESLLKRYQINLIVDNSQLNGAAVVYENQPNHQTLLGCVENMAMMGALVTDFSLIKAGAVHRANGGFLILDAEQLLMQPFAWEGLKRALQSKELRFDALERTYSLVATVSLEPEPIPLDLKIILLGDRQLYYLLYEMDPEFAELFKVAADFDDYLQRSEEHHMLFARQIGNNIDYHQLLHLDKRAVARMIEQAARFVEDSNKLSLHVGDMVDLLREANFWAQKEAASMISETHIQEALNARERRHDRLREQIYDEINRGVIKLQVSGSHHGQVNALSVLNVGGFEFGQPSRVTANCRFGDDTIIDIEREVELGGNIHAKGVLILSGYLGATYSADKPLSMSASIVFEQNYGEVEGDSATVAELCALLSSIARIPLKQSLAITGSMNQHGDVQAIGGVNEKIEGFFDVCNLLGLTGEQGVIIPQSNVQHLMLRQDVIDAVAKGQFHIYAVSRVEQALALLSTVELGEPDEQGLYPENSFNAAVYQRLQTWADVHKSDKESTQDEGDSET